LNRSTPFEPRRWLLNGHLQTIVGNFLPRQDRLPTATTEIVRVPLPEEMLSLPGAVEMDRKIPSHVLLHCHWQAASTTAVVLIHGLEGSSYSQYVIGNANRMFSAGFSVVRMNMRNCGNTEALTPTLYHSGMSGDVRAVLQWLIERGFERIALVGYSMGGNLVLKAVGELGGNAPKELIGTAAISPPMDLAESADALHAKQNRVYEQKFLAGLRQRYKRKYQMYPAIFAPAAFEHVRSIRDFDEYVMTPYCGFQGASDYYYRAASARVLDRIAVPAFILHAMDDPFIRITAETRQKIHANPLIELLEPAHGGHCAFLENPTATDDGRYAERLLLQFVQQCIAATCEATR